MTSLTALIVDDEEPIRTGVRRLLEAHDDIEVVAEAEDGVAAVEKIEQLDPDLVFLDVKMPELDGFGVLESLDRELPGVIFVTAYDEYALRAFEHHAVDYVLKPFDDDRFRRAVERAKRRLAERDATQEVKALLDELRRDRGYLERVLVRSEGRIRLIDVAEIELFEAADNYVRVWSEGKPHLIRHTVKALERQLDPRLFVRIHRSAIVRIGEIEELESLQNGDYRVLMKSGREATLSRTYRSHFQDAVGWSF